LRDATWPADEADRANRAEGHLRSGSLKGGPVGKDREISVIEPLMVWRNSGSSRVANADLT
jgi:hypothetical protein